MSLRLRLPAVAAKFYPGCAQALSRDIEQMLASAPKEFSRRPKAVIVPHASYIYSGPIAASVYARLAALRDSRDSISRVVLLGPTHRVAIRGVALPSCTGFATPLGVVPVDQQAVTTLDGLPQVVVDDAAHADEHSLEVQLPFLQTVLGDFSLLPLAVGDASPEEVAEVLERVWGGAETLIVVSSDLSHYLPYAMARQIDTRTARDIVSLAPTLDHQQACGASPINGLLLAARRHQLQAETLDLRNSGDTAGDKARVVGYGAFAFHETESHAH